MPAPVVGDAVELDPRLCRPVRQLAARGDTVEVDGSAQAETPCGSEAARDPLGRAVVEQRRRGRRHPASCGGSQTSWPSPCEAKTCAVSG